MYTILALGTVGLIFGIFLAAGKKERRIGDFIFGSVIGTVIGAVIGLALAVTVCLALIPMKEVTHNSMTMVSMRTSDGIAGSFLLGSGSFSNSSTYHFLVKEKDGSVSPRSVPADYRVRITEDPSLSNVGYWQTISREADENSLLYMWTLGASDRSRIIRQEFRVPAGALVHQFKVQ